MSLNNKASIASKNAVNLALNSGEAVDSVKFSTRFVGATRKVVSKGGLNQLNLSYIVIVKNLMIKKFAMASRFTLKMP